MRRPHLFLAALGVSALSATLAACGSSASERITAVSVASPARWKPAVLIRRVLDLSTPRRDGTIVLATAGHLALLLPSGGVQQFARGPAGYANPGGEEPYLTLSTGERVASARCTFPQQALYVLRLQRGTGVTAVDVRGDARGFASLPRNGLENGITFDSTGRFGHRLLVTATNGSRTTVYAIDCRGSVSTLTTTAPKLEGGISVAPAASGLARGGDVGVESTGFVPPGFRAGSSALVADRRTPGNPHPGDDAVLRIDGSSLIAAGVRPGDLIVATEGGAQTDAITCTGQSCRVRHIADGPSIAHLEGHIVFTDGRAPGL